MNDDGLSRPLSYGEKQALAEQARIDKARGQPFEDREKRLAEIQQTPELKKVKRALGSESQP